MQINNDIASRATSSDSWNRWKDIANMVCTRESTYRVALDITAFDIPTMGADLFRGPKKLAESAFEGLLGGVGILISPIMNSLLGKFFSKTTVKGIAKDEAVHYLRFTMDELENKEAFLEGIKRIKKEGPQDQKIIASIHKGNAANKYLNKAKEIEDFCDKVEKEISTLPEDSNQIEQKLTNIYKLKKHTIIGESLLEGGWWGSFGLTLRLFRKYVLGEGRYTGTKNYVNDSESDQLGESDELSFKEYAVGAGSALISPILNTILLNRTSTKEKASKNKFLTKIRENFDMTHGIYPKLGLLFTITTIPKWVGTILLSQGLNERLERILKLCTVIPSWWLGHRATNGILAKKADVKLAEAHGVDKGILVDEEYLNSRFPEPAKINKIYEKTKDNQTLWEDAEDKHAKSLYKGFTLHSIGVFLINLAVNQVIKLRALSELGK